MDLVERWFSALTTKKLQRSWHKNAEEILDPFAGYCAAISHRQRSHLTGH